LVNIELGNDEVDQLYDLRTDKGEKNNIAKNNPEKVNELKAILEKEMSK
jgi:hypothetical protein